jgi:hypothetical protein
MTPKCHRNGPEQLGKTQKQPKLLQCSPKQPKTALKTTSVWPKMIGSGLKRPAKNKTTQYRSEMAPKTSETAQNDHTTAPNGPKQSQYGSKWPETAWKGPEMAPKRP